MQTFQQWLEALTPAQQALLDKAKKPPMTLAQAKAKKELEKYQQQIDPSGKTTTGGPIQSRPVHITGREKGKYGT